MAPGYRWSKVGWLSSKDGIWLMWICGWVIQLKAPKYKPLFIERNGYTKPKLKFRGWRLFVFRMKKISKF